MRDKFILGLFDNPFVDEEKAKEIAGNDHFVDRGKEAQAKSMVLLKNEGILPLKQGIKIYAEGFTDLEGFKQFGELVKEPSAADVIALRINTPFGEPKGKSMLEKFFRQGRLYYSDEELAHIVGLIGQKPAVVVANLERPAILTEVNEKCRALMTDFGTSDEVLIEVLFGKRTPQGKLPFELPSSLEAVENQMEDLPYDSENPLYEFGFGLSYE